MREQKALLEVYFLLFYNKLFPSGQSLLDILDAIKHSDWGDKQVNEAYFDTETKQLVSSIPVLLTLVVVENLNLERASLPDSPDLAIIAEVVASNDDLVHPVTLLKVHECIIQLGVTCPSQSAPLILAWSFVLSRVTESLSISTLPEAYNDLAFTLLPKQLHPKRSGQGQRQVFQRNESSQPLYQLLASHALSPTSGTLSAIYSMVISPLLFPGPMSEVTYYASIEPNVPGYLSVMRSLVSALPLLVHPSYLPLADFDSLIAIFQALYSNPAAALLRGQFWGLFDDASDTTIKGEMEILDLAKSRFPVQTMPLLRLLRSLSGGPLLSFDNARDTEYREAEEVSFRCSKRVRQYLSSVSSLTQVEPATSPIVPLPYEGSANFDAGPQDVISLRPIPVSASLFIPAGVPGRIVSDQDKRPAIISWDLSNHPQRGFNVWRLLGDILNDFVNKSRPIRRRHNQAAQTDVFGSVNDKAVPPFQWDSENEQVQVVGVILDM